MNTSAGKRLRNVWLLLSVATLLYLGMALSADRAGAPTASGVVTVSAIAIALVKVRIIFREFMEVRHAPVLLGRLTDICVAVVGVGVLGGYFLGVALG